MGGRHCSEPCAVSAHLVPSIPYGRVMPMGITHSATRKQHRNSLKVTDLDSALAPDQHRKPLSELKENLPFYQLGESDSLSDSREEGENRNHSDGQTAELHMKRCAVKTLQWQAWLMGFLKKQLYWDFIYISFSSVILSGFDYIHGVARWSLQTILGHCRVTYIANQVTKVHHA